MDNFFAAHDGCFHLWTKLAWAKFGVQGISGEYIYFFTNNDLSYHLSIQNIHHHPFVLYRSLFFATSIVASSGISLFMKPVLFHCFSIFSHNTHSVCWYHIYVPGYRMSHTARFLFVKLQTSHKHTTFSRPLPVFMTHQFHSHLFHLVFLQTWYCWLIIRPHKQDWQKTD